MESTAHAYTDAATSGISALESIRGYWNSRALGYSQKTRMDLDASEEMWLNRLLPYLGTKRMRILDIGCGPGFFSLLLARLGHEVTAFDYAEEMLARAAENAKSYNVSLELRKGDAQNLPFEDESFDLIVSRNLTWNMEQPALAYAEWLRVLKSGAGLDDTAHTPQMMQGVDPARMEAIAWNLPLSREDRPEWDVQTLERLGAVDIRVSVEKQSARYMGKEREIVTAFCVAARRA